MNKLMNQTSQDEIRGKYVQRFQNMLSEHNDKLSKSENPEEISKIKQSIAGLEQSIECAKVLPVVRDPKVPKDIPDHDVWNDCWYDEERKAFVTLNQYFKKLPNTRTRDIQIQYDEGNTDLGIIIEKEKIQFIDGYPSILREVTDGSTTGYFLPTITENMLSSKIVKDKFRPSSNIESVLYTTESEAWIEALGTNLTEREYLLACEVMPHLVKTPMEVLKAISGRPYNQNLYQQQMAEINKTQQQ